MSGHPQPTFRRVAPGTYEVRLSGVLCGTVSKVGADPGLTYWLGRYTDGDRAYSSDTRIDAAWKLINS